MKKAIIAGRYVLAAVFLFSGFVKGVDPLGTAYKIEDYFIAYQMAWALPLSIVTSFGLIALELTLGALLVFNLLPKFTRWVLTIVMLFFTFVTLYDALYNPVPDCGCFGDAIILTNWQTFYKNLIIDFLIVGLFFYYPRRINIRKHMGISFVILLAILSFTYYNLQHLPLIDFRFWKVGTQVFDTQQKPIDLYLTYQNKTTGEKQEFLSPNFPYQDSIWLANWDFLFSREFNPNTNSQSMMIFDLDGSDATQEVLGFAKKSLLIISHNLDGIGQKKIARLHDIIQIADDEALPILFITASLGDKINDFATQNQIDIPVFLADDIDLKTIIRSNPGLVLLENGKVIKKWAFADFPSIASQIYD